MQRKYIGAFNALKKIGVPVYVHADDRGNFSIDAESPEADNWVSYWSPHPDWDFGMESKLREELYQRGLFAEWVNPGRLAVHLV